MGTRFRTLLLVGFGALVAIALASGILGVLTLAKSSSRSVEVSAQIVDELEAVQQVRVQAERVVSDVRGYLLTRSDWASARVTAGEAALERSLETLRQRTHAPHIAAQIAVVELRLLDYSRAASRVASSHERAFEEQLVPRQRMLDAAVGMLVRLERGELHDETERAANDVRRFGVTVFAGWTVAFGIAIGLAIVIMRKLAGQYHRVQEAREVAADAAAQRKQILDIVAHDLMTPLNAVVLGLEVSEARGEHVPHATMIRNAVNRMLRLVNDLLDVSRAEHSKLVLDRREHHATSLLAATAELFAEQAKVAHVELQQECDAELRATVDRDRVVQILSNLVGNAINHSRKGGVIVLSAHERPARRIRFAVRDTGPGMTPEDASTMFEPYRQGARRGRGSLGLGLYICKSLVEAHGGVIGVDTAPGKGTTFWFDLPTVG